MGELARLPNLGAALEEQLAAVGITTAQQLQELGAREAWLRIQTVDVSACLNRLTALEGAVRGVRKTALPADVKEELKAFYNAHKL